MTSAHRFRNSSRGSCLNLPSLFFGALRGTGPRATGAGVFFCRAGGLSPAVPSPCLKQDGQDLQDELQVREDLNRPRGGWGALRGPVPRTTDTEARVFFVVRGPVSCDRFLILAILIILAILLQTL